MLLTAMMLTSFFGSGGIDNIAVHNHANHNDRFRFRDEYAATATITWTTAVPATSKVLYGPAGGALELQSRFDGRFKTRHTIRLQYRLQEGIDYDFKVVSRDATGVEYSSSITNLAGSGTSFWWEAPHDRWYQKADWDENTHWINGGRAFRLTVDLNQGSSGAWLALTRYERWGSGARVWINGELAGFWSFGFSLGTLDIAPYLTLGENVIAVDRVDGGFSLLCEGEIALNDGTTLVVQSRNNTWRTSDAPPSGWLLPGFDDSSWDLAAGDTSPLSPGAPYSQGMVTALPGDTPRRNLEKRFTAALVQRNRLHENELLLVREERAYLGIADPYKATAETLVGEALDVLYDLEPMLDTARTQLIADDRTGAALTLDAIEDLLDEVGLLSEVQKGLLECASRLANLTMASTMVPAPIPVLPRLLDEATEGIAAAEAAIDSDDFPTAKQRLTTTNSALATAKLRLECGSGMRLGALNETAHHSFGWLRFRGQYAAVPQGVTLDEETRSLRLRENTAFATQPETPAGARDGLGFLSPFAAMVAEEDNFSIGNGLTHIAWSQAGSPVIRPTSGPLYTRAGDGDWDANWLLLWDEAGVNRVYLVVFEHQPEILDLLDNRIQITRTGGVGTLVAYRLYADGASFEGDTGSLAGWSAALPQAVQNDITAWSAMMLRRPIAYTELYEESGGTAQTKIRYHYAEFSDDWGTTPISHAPLPNALSFAMAGGYTGLSVEETVENSGYLAGTWGPYQLVRGTDTLTLQLPSTKPTLLNGVNDPLGRTLVSDEDVARSGFNLLRGQLLILDENATPARYRFIPGWETMVTNYLSQVNASGLTAMPFMWTMVGQSDGLDSNQELQDLFVEGWRAFAAVARDYDVVYDLLNEPEFPNVTVYNDLMQRTAAAIRGEDPTHPIIIEGFDNFAQDFEGMVHPGTSNTWYEFHPYNPLGDQTESTVDRYYPGYAMSWFENTYYDQDSYLAHRWLAAVRAGLADDRIQLFNGEYGVQAMPRGDDERIIADTVALARRFHTGLAYYVSRGWVYFDLYAGADDTFVEKTELTSILAGLNAPPDTRFCTLLDDLPAWRQTAMSHGCGTVAPDIRPYIAYITNNLTCP